jgi:hypothetical protein
LCGCRFETDYSIRLIGFLVGSVRLLAFAESFGARKLKFMNFSFVIFVMSRLFLSLPPARLTLEPTGRLARLIS